MIGNPPYIRMEAFTLLKAYLRTKYEVHADRSDLYAYFLEEGFRLLASDGRLGMIVSNKFIKARYGKPLRRLLSRETKIDTIADFAGASVFQGATVRTVVIVGLKAAVETANGKVTYVPVPDSQTILELTNFSTTVRAYSEGTAFTLAPSSLTGDEWQLCRKTMWQS